MRELQRQRGRANGVTLETSTTHDAEAEPADDAPGIMEAGLESNFTTQADSGDIDQNMLKYIEEQMQGGGGGGGGADERAESLNPEEAQLYTTPAHLLGAIAAAGGGGPDAAEDSANRWLAGIMEVPLSTSEKMATLERTEEAKRAMAAKQRERYTSRADGEQGHHMVVPGNFNSNFHQHRRENAIAKKAQFGGKGGGKGGGPGNKGLAGDSAALGRFKAHERRKGGR